MGRARVLSCITATALLALALGQSLMAQSAQSSPSAGPPSTVSTTASVTYDVVTIRPDHQGPGSVSVSINLDLYRATNVSLIDLLRDAYHLRPGQLQGQPKWADDDRFDIQAKVLDTPAETLRRLTQEDRERMMRGLLADRFHLQTHTETRTLPVFELVPAKGGAQLQPVLADSRNNEFHGVSAGGLSVHNGQLVAHYLPMERFVDFLGYQVDRIVLDKTGLPGNYNLQLNWTPDNGTASEDTAAAPPLFTALEQQLGLKLVPTKAPVPIIVIDHVEAPTAN